MGAQESLQSIRARAAEDEYCRREDCRYRHWRSGPMPTHRRGTECPEGEHVPVTLDEWLGVLAALEAALTVAESHRFKGKGEPDDMPDECETVADAVALEIVRAARSALEAGA